MDETSYRNSIEERIIHVNFDLRSEENCFIELSFSEDDVLAIINMEHLGKRTISLEGICGQASLGNGASSNKQICFAYKNGSSGVGTVIYPYKKLTTLLNQAFNIFSRN